MPNEMSKVRPRNEGDRNHDSGIYAHMLLHKLQKRFGSMQGLGKKHRDHTSQEYILKNKEAFIENEILAD